MHYPVTTEFGQNYSHMTETLKAISKINLPKLIFGPIQMQDQKKISTAIREFREKNSSKCLVCEKFKS